MSNYFAENLMDLLRIKNIPQRKLAEMLGVTPSTVNQWVKKKREPDYDLLIRICILLDTEPNEILGYQRLKIEN